MHPTLAHYLNLDTAVDTLTREERGEELRPEEQPFAKVARAHPEARAEVMKASGKGQPSPDAQRALLTLAAYAAAEALRRDDATASAAEAARAALAAEGASPEEVEQFIATLVLEEAFTGDEDPDLFDGPFLEEALRGVPALAKLTSEAVDSLRQGFEGSAPAGWKQVYEVAVDALFATAWGDGPQPINTEHMDGAVEEVRERLGEAQAPKGFEALRRFVEVLAGAQLVGPLRKQRLLGVVNDAEQEQADVRGQSH